MKFGLFMEWPNPDVREFKEIFNDGIDQIKLSEELGYDYVLIAEHHFSNYGFSPAPPATGIKDCREYGEDKDRDRSYHYS